MLELFSGWTSPPPLWLQVLVPAGWVGTITLVAEELNRRKWVEPESVRKIVHIGTGNVILLAWWLGIGTELIVAASVLFGSVALISYRLPILPGINSVGRKSFGTFFYAVSIGVLAALFWSHEPRYAVLGVLVMTWGDGMAALVGQRYGQHRYSVGNSQKSWEGSLTMAAVAYGIGFLVLLGTQGLTGATVLVPLGMAIAATLLETVSTLGVDNLTVPLGSGAIAFWLNQLWT